MGYAAAYPIAAPSTSDRAPSTSDRAPAPAAAADRLSQRA
jgi:hypothetical protein